jgi:5-methylcytosine-specific restriction protein A
MAWSKLSRHERGYGASWDKLRKQIMERDAGLCQPCKYTPAHAVDHITSKAKAAKLKWAQAQIDDPRNLQAICSPCHLTKSNEEQGKTLRPKVRIGADGWPTKE